VNDGISIWVFPYMWVSWYLEYSKIFSVSRCFLLKIVNAQEMLISRHGQKIQFFWKFNILRRKHLFELKLFGSFMNHETYIWEEFQVETTSCTKGKCFSIFGIFKIPKIRFFPLESTLMYDS
jgi:hypothetical protein